MTTIEAIRFVGAGSLPKDCGETLAKEVLKQHDFYNSDGLTINAKGVRSELLISVFVSAFYTTLMREDHSLGQYIGDIIWETDYPFQQDNFQRWSEKYRPEFNWVTSNIRKINKPEHVTVHLTKDDAPQLMVVEDGNTRVIDISADVAEVLIAEGYSYGD